LILCGIFITPGYFIARKYAAKVKFDPLLIKRNESEGFIGKLLSLCGTQWVVRHPFDKREM